MLFDRILVPLDGSALAESVLTQVRRLLAHRDAELLLLQVVTMPPSTEADAGEPLDLLWGRATEYLSKVAARLSEEGFRVRPKIVEGFPANRILDVARRERATLIAMSTHGRTGISRWVFGSVTEKVLRASPIPVLAIPSFLGAGGEAYPRGAQEVPFEKILVPIAAAERSLDVIAPAAELAGHFGSKVLLLNVCEGIECTVPVHEMRTAFERLREKGVPAEPLVKEGDPAVRILETSREQGADLIAMTTHGRRGVSRWILGSVAEKVLRAANVPLLVVRPAKRASPVGSTAMPVEFHSDP